MALEQLDLETGLNKVGFSIRLMQAWQPIDDYYLAFSGGKDSVALRAVADEAKLRYQASYHPSPLDPPEVIAFIREYYPDTVFEKPVVPFWKAFDKKGYPLRRRRWCCEYIKEWGGSDRVCLVGLRSTESRSRRHRCFIDNNPKNKTRFMNPARMIISPLLQWTDYDVWQYIRENNLPYCSLYDEGAERRGYGEGDFTRIGCVMCPLASAEQRLKEYYRFPKIAVAWQHGFKRLYENKPDTYGKRWTSWEEMFWWWMEQPPPD